MPFASIRVESAEAGARSASFFYSEHGAGRPIVALHGWTLDHRAQEASLEALFAERAGWRRIYVDLLGHGRSEAPGWVRSHDDMLGALSAFIDAVIPDQRFALVGLSYGAALVHRLVEARAGQIDGVVLTVPPAGDAALPQHAVRHVDAGSSPSLAPRNSISSTSSYGRACPCSRRSGAGSTPAPHCAFTTSSTVWAPSS